MTLKRLMLLLGILVVLAGAGIMGLWQYAYTPQGRARVIIAQIKGDTTSLRGWMLQHNLIRPGFSEPPPAEEVDFPSFREIAAANAMGGLGREVLPIVIEALRDGDHSVRMAAIAACQLFRDPGAIGPIIQCARDEAVPQGSYNTVQLFCVTSLAQIRPEAYGPLVSLLDDPDGNMRWLAAKGLGMLKDRRALEALVRHLNEKNTSVARGAAAALGEIGDRKAIPALLRTLKNTDMDDIDRIPSAGALARMGRREGLGFLTEMLKSPSVGFRDAAAGELGTTDIKEAINLLLPLSNDPEPAVRARAAEALGNLQDPRGILVIKKLLNDPDPYVREIASRTLRRLGDSLPPNSQPARP